MSADDAKTDEAGQATEPACPGPIEEAEEADAEQAPLTLDRYLSRRRPPVRMGWPQAVSMLAMLIALLLILFYKDQCGGSVSQLMRSVAPGEQASEQASPPVRYQPNE